MTSTRSGQVVGRRYRLVAELGSGGFGRVWQARDETLGVDVAIKELRLLPGMSQAEQAERLARATREARNAARLRAHENVVAIHDIVTEDGLPWIVMELIDGASLDERIKAHGPLPADQAATVAAALLAAIGAAHQKGVVHRDIKPANVMLAANGKVLLTDFGTAVHNTDTTLTATGMLVGSPEYTAPERLRGTDGLPASDLFSVGVTLYQAVEGVSPFRRDTPAATLSAVLMDQAPAPQRAGSLTQLITRLLNKDPDTRPTVPEALAMADVPGDASTAQVQVTTGAVPHKTKIIKARGDTGKPMGWQKVVEVLMALIVVLGILGFQGGGAVGVALVWESIPWGMRTGVIVDAVLAGVLCTGIARLVPASAGQTVTVIIGAAGFLVGGCATGFVVISFLRNLMGIQIGTVAEDDVWLAQIVITVVLLVAAGWAWVSRKSRYPNLEPR